MAKCWCGRDHERLADKGDTRNGSVKHGVSNWKLYELRMVDQGKDPFGEDGKEMAEQNKK